MITKEEIYTKLINNCKPDKQSLINGLQILLEEATNKYFAKQEKLCISYLFRINK